MQMSCGQPDRFWGHVCVADEHFVPTLFAAYKLDKQRDGVGVITYTDWNSSPGSWHPKTFMPGDTREDIIHMRTRSRAASYVLHSSAHILMSHACACLCPMLVTCKSRSFCIAMVRATRQQGAITSTCSGSLSNASTVPDEGDMS
jgi:hypothetical protein